jgi:hypothetical protein
MKHIVNAFKRGLTIFGYAQTAVGLIKNTGVHKPVVYGVKHTAKAVYTVATHPFTKAAARTGVSVGIGTVRGFHKIVTHPTTAKITHKAWLHGSKVAKHTTKFMVKSALKGFKLINK